MMMFEQRRDKAIALMEEKKMWRSNYAPPILRLMWRMGVNMPPPPFAPFWLNTLFFGVWFGPLWGVLMWFMVWKNQGYTGDEALILSLVTGLLFGFFMALFHYWRKKANRLSDWNDL